MSEKIQNTVKSTSKDKHPERKSNEVKCCVSFLTSKDLIIKQNIRYLLSLLYSKNDRKTFEKILGIDNKTLQEFQTLDRNIMPSEDVMIKIERYFESMFGVAVDSWKLDDKYLFSKLEQYGLDVVSTVRNTDRIKNNIRALREYHEETQGELARAIGVKTSSITNYEKFANGRLPDQEKLIAIAQHYRITVDELLCQELRFEPLCDLLINSKDYKDIIRNFLTILIPFFEYTDACPEEEKNATFVRATALQNNLIAAMIDNSLHEHIDELTELTNLYEAAVHEGALEAVANHLGWIILLGIGIMGISEQLMKNENEISNVKTKVSDILKWGVLPQPAKVRKSIDREEGDEYKQAYLKNNEKQIIQYIHELKEAGWYEIADYYNATRYVYGVVKNNLTGELNRAIGHEMLRSLVLMRNPYVEELNKAHEGLRNILGLN